MENDTPKTTPRAQIRLPVDEPLKKPIDTPFKTGGGGMVGVAFMIAAMAIILIALATWTYR